MDLQTVKTIGAELQGAFLAACQCKSNYELTVLNVGDHETPQRGYKQCLDELVRRVGGLGRAEIELEEVEDKLQIAKDKEAIAAGAEKREANRERRKLEISKWELGLAIEGQLREFNALYAAYQQMPTFSAEQIQEAEREYHHRRKMGMAQRQIEAGRGVDPELLRVMADMGVIPNDHADKFIEFLQQQKELK